MNDEEFRARFNADRRDNKLTWVGAGEVEGIAVGTDSGKGVILLHRGASIPMADARFIEDRTDQLLAKIRDSRPTT